LNLCEFLVKVLFSLLNACYITIVKLLTSNFSNAHEMHNSLIAISVRRLSWSISHPFRRIAVFMCVLQLKIAKNYYNPLFWGSRSLKVISVDTP